jgi:hypothetical protein
LKEGDMKGDEGVLQLTKRELFAAMAMQGILASEGETAYAVDGAAKRAVNQADALIAELSIAARVSGRSKV